MAQVRSTQSKAAYLRQQKGFGPVVLHVPPGAAIGGTLAIVQDGDIIQLNVAKEFYI